MLGQNAVKILLIESATLNEKLRVRLSAVPDIDLVESSLTTLNSPPSDAIESVAAILVDLEAPQSDGLALAQALRTHATLHSVPIILFNAPITLDLDELYSLENIDVLPAPVPVKALEAKITFYKDLFLKTEEFKQHNATSSSNLFLENIKDYAFVKTDLNRTITEWRGEAEKITGWSSQDVVGQKVDLMFTPEDRAVGQPAIEAQSALDTGRTEDQRWHVRKDGTRFFADGVTVPLRHANGEVHELAKIFKDATQRKNSEEELQRSKDLFSLLLESSGEGIFGLDQNGNCIFLNKAGESILGYTSQEMMGASALSLIHPSQNDGSEGAIGEDLIMNAIEKGQSARLDDQIFLRKDGSAVPTTCSVSPIVVNGIPRGAVITFADDSQRRSANAQLKASEERYRTLFNSIDEGFALIEMLFDEYGHAVDYRFLDVNATFEAQTGIANAVGRTAREIVPDLESHWFEIYGNVALTGESVRFVEGSDSMGKWFSVYATRVGGISSRTVVLLFNDISERKRAEAEREELLSKLQIAHDQMADVFHQAPAVMCTLKGPDHIFDMVNDRYLQLIGWRGELTGKAVRDALPEVVEQGYIQILDEVFQTGKPFVGKDATVRLQRLANNDAEERVVDFVYLPLKDVDGTVSGILAHGIDITERTRAEEDLRRLAVDLSEADRRKTEFLATLAHELRNPLAPIQNALEVMRLSGDDGAAVSRVRGIMQRQVSHMTHLIDDLLDVARITSGKVELKKQRTGLATLITSAVETSMPLIELNNHQLEVHISQPEIALNIDPARMSQVISNLLTNAAKYTPQGGRIALSAAVINSTLEIIVSDNGLGIPPDQLLSIFELFTQVGRNMSLAQGGLGIGLSLVKHLVELHGGVIEASSQGVGLGSTFSIRLPLQNDALSSVHEAAAENQPDREDILLILVADDNEDAANTLAALLEMNEHVTHVVHDGLSAVKAAEQFKPDVAFLDIGMPGLTGFEVATKIKESSNLKNTSLIALTGWGTDEDRERTRQAGFDYHLTKPVAFPDIQEILRKISNPHHE